MRTFRLGVWGLLGLCASCFDSDEKASQAGSTGSTSSTSIALPETGSGTSTSTGGTTQAPDVTCRDAVACLGGCAADLLLNPDPEPEYDCFLICEEALTVPEAVDLLRLVNCASDRCTSIGLCSDGGTGTGGDTGDATATDTGDEVDMPALDPCLQCIFDTVADPEPPGCVEFARACD